MQMWRPLRGPVNNSPLAMIDAATVAKEDLQSYRLEFPGRTGYNYAVAENPNHRWASCGKTREKTEKILGCLGMRESPGTQRRRAFVLHQGLCAVYSRRSCDAAESRSRPKKGVES